MTRMMVGNKNHTLSKSMILAGLGLSLTFGAQSVSAQQNQPQATPRRRSGRSWSTSRRPPNLKGRRISRILRQGTFDDRQRGPAGSSAAEPSGATNVSDPACRDCDTRARRRVAFQRSKPYPGDAFSAALDQPIVVDGWVIARQGASRKRAVSLWPRRQGTGTTRLN